MKKLELSMLLKPLLVLTFLGFTAVGILLATNHLGTAIMATNYLYWPLLGIVIFGLVKK